MLICSLMCRYAWLIVQKRESRKSGGQQSSPSCIIAVEEKRDLASTSVSSNAYRNFDQGAGGSDGHAGPRQRGKSEPTSSDRIPN